MDRSSKTKYQQRYCSIEQCPRSNGLNVEPFIPRKQNTHPFQMRMEYFQRQTTKQASTNSRKIEIISSIFSDHNAFKLETNFKEETQTTEIHGG